MTEYSSLFDIYDINILLKQNQDHLFIKNFIHNNFSIHTCHFWNIHRGYLEQDKIEGLDTEYEASLLPPDQS